jgi:hypothetical protein
VTRDGKATPLIEEAEFITKPDEYPRNWRDPRHYQFWGPTPRRLKLNKAQYLDYFTKSLSALTEGIENLKNIDLGPEAIAVFQQPIKSFEAQRLLVIQELAEAEALPSGTNWAVRHQQMREKMEMCFGGS